jgi:hypothetical protein
MAARTETSAARVKRWFERITPAEKARDAWATKFQTDLLERYWEGFQWGAMPAEDSERKYTINMVYAAMEAAKPSLLFRTPTVKMTPRPTKADDLGSTIREQAEFCQDTVQTFLDDRRVNFQAETELALHEAYFRFGIVEVGYTADWIDNPHAGKPVLKGDSNDPLLDEQSKPIEQPTRVIKEGSETLYVKRIPASTFLVSVSSKNSLADNDWVAYHEWHYVEDVKRHPDYKNTESLSATGVISDRLRNVEALSPEELERRHGMVRLWKLWDLRTKKRYVLAEGHPKFLQDGIPYTTLPFAVLKFHERLNQFYPLPPVYNWKSPQDEVNETREMQRVHRRRFTRRYTMRDGVFDPTEIEKLESGEDGVYAVHKGAPGEQPLVPVPDAPLDGAVWNNLAAGKEDFTQVSLSSGETRGLPQAATATQANIVNTQQQIRQSAERTRVAAWLADIARIMLETVREKMALPFWIQKHVDITSPAAAEEAIEVTALWQQITTDQLGELDFDIAIELASMSPVTQDAQKASWIEMLTAITNPAVIRYLAISPYMLRRTLHLAGIRNATDVKAIEEAIQAGFLQEQMAMMAQQGSSPAGKGVPSDAAPVQSQAGIPAGAAGME